MKPSFKPATFLWAPAVCLMFAACGPASYSSSSAMPRPQQQAGSSAAGTDAAGLGQLADSTIRLSSGAALCLDVTDVKQADGTPMQVWGCHGRSNQTFAVDQSGHIKVYGSHCLTVDTASQAVVLGSCTDGDVSQTWHIDGSTIVSSTNNACLSVTTSPAKNGTQVVIKTCSSQDAAQQWTVGSAVLGTSSGSTSPASTPTTLSPHAATTLTTVAAAPMDALLAKAPTRLKAQFANIEQAAASFNLQPQLLVAIAMEESTGGSDPSAYSNGGGMFQFTNTDTWGLYGTKNPNDRQNDALEVTASAYYLATLINQHQGDLAKALRDYNGPISEGANPNYITEIYSKMAGNI